MVMVIAPATEEDCTMMVSTTPKAQKISTDQMPMPVKPVMNSSTSGLQLMSGTESLRNDRPRNSRPKPMRNSPVSLSWDLREKSRGSAMPMSGRASEATLNL